jgi:hypothetical protein
MAIRVPSAVWAGAGDEKSSAWQILTFCEPSIRASIHPIADFQSAKSIGE